MTAKKQFIQLWLLKFIIMNKYKKLFIYLLLLIFALPSISVIESCSPSYRNYRKIAKKKNVKHAKKYKGRFQKKLQKGTTPIHHSYIISKGKGTKLHY